MRGMDTVIARADLAKSTGAKIRELRIARGMSQRELAESIGMTRVSLTRIEAGEQLPDWTTVVNLAELFGVTTETLKNF